MKKENFGTIMYNGKMVNLDESSILDLEKIGEHLKENERKLKEKMMTIYNKWFLNFYSNNKFKNIV